MDLGIFVDSFSFEILDRESHCPGKGGVNQKVETIR